MTFPQYQSGPLLRTYGMSPTNWRRVAGYCAAHGDSRIAKTIARGIGRWKNRERWWVNLRFKDGSIAKLDAVLAAMADELGGLDEADETTEGA